MDSEADKEFILYYRENCHLCESMRLALLRLQKSIVFSWQEVDIDRDVELIRRFDVLVPVLYYRDQEVCHHFINESAIREIIGE